MTKTRMFMFAALAVIVALGVCGQVQAQELQIHPGKFTIVGRVPVVQDAAPDVAIPALLGEDLSMAVIPAADGSGNPYWPCFTGSSSQPDCDTIPSGGVVTGVPYLTWSKTTCTAKVATAPCAELTWWFQDDSTDVTDDLIVTLKAIQGAKTLWTDILNAGPNPFSGYIIVLTDGIAFGPGDCLNGGTCKKPAAGEVTLEATVTVGTESATQHQIIGLQ